jgi:hypothetical protein
LLLYVDGGSAAFAVTEGVTPPANLQYSTEARTGEQISAGGNASERIWARATSGGKATIRVQVDAPAAARNLPIPPDTYVALGTLAADGDEVVIVAPSAASGIITFSGTFRGRITVTGATAEGAAVEGGRLLFRTGVGSIGRDNVLFTTDVPHEREYRFVAGGDRIIVRASDWVDGTANIKISASRSSSIVFVNGPVHDAEEEATRGGNAYLSGTGVVSVTGTQALFVKLENLSTSSANVFLMRRLFGGNRTANDPVLEYQAYSNPTMILSNVGPEINRRIGDANTAEAIWSWQAAGIGDITIGGTQGSGGFVPHLGLTEVRDVEVIIPPGESLGLVVTGAGANIGQAARLSISLEWYEEAVF